MIKVRVVTPAYLRHGNNKRPSLKWMGHQGFAFDAKVIEERYLRKFPGKSRALIGAEVPVDRQHRHFIPDEVTPFLRDVPSRILRNGAGRWYSACQRFFKKVEADHPEESRPAVGDDHPGAVHLLISR